jgi:lactate dehydrogenase-like 2-hydroxyacid dehydrogenase
MTYLWRRDIEKNLGLEYASFAEILKASDVLSINVPLTEGYERDDLR